MAWMKNEKMSGWFLPLLIIVYICLINSVQSAPLSSYLVAFSPDLPLPFNHIAINNVTGDIYIGARETLYQLNSDLTIKNTVVLGQCPSPNEANINDNKLLVVAPSPENKLITCGGCDGYCETRSLSNISLDVVRRDSISNQLVANTDAPTVGVVVLGANVVSDGVGVPDDRLYLFTGVSQATSTLTSVSKHPITDLQYIQRVSIPQTSQPIPVFKHSISYNEYIFYFMIRDDNVYLGRLCRNSLDLKFASYTEIELQCGSYNIIQSAYIGPAGSDLAGSLSINMTEDVLYAVFSSGSSSGLCLYKMSDVQQSYEDAVLGCIRGTNAGEANSYLSGSRCNTYAGYTPADLCTAFEGITIYQYPSGTSSLDSSPVLTIPDVTPTSIVTTIERNHTVAFIGNTQGQLHKVHIVSGSSGYIYENVSLGSGSVLQEMFLDVAKEQLTLVRSSEHSSQVLTLNLVDCGQFATCDECIGTNGGNDGDPYCGWCTLEARCTRYDACPLPDLSTRWLSYNALQCVEISEIKPDDKLPYDQTEQQINITVQQLPELANNEAYQCEFDTFRNLATVSSVNTVTCTTPPSDEIPTFPAGAYEVRMALSIFSTESEVGFITTDFTFFDCSRITSCTSCVSSAYPCDWCVYENRCTDDSGTCQTVVLGENNPNGSGNQGQEYCPQLLGTTEDFFIPVGVDSAYSLSARNLPTESVTYDCILHIEGRDERVSSTIFNDSYILCNERQYTYNENILQKNVSVSVLWNGQNSIDEPSETKVTLYKCSVNGGSCSRCLSPNITPSNLNCGWCGSDCNVIQSEVCQNNNFLNQSQTEMCDAPRITDFDPMAGPVNGRTRLDIRGTDIGVQFDDVLEVLIGSLECELSADMASYYQPGQSVSCLTSVSTEQVSNHIQITVMSGDSNKTGESQDKFNYRIPEIGGFDPTEGQAAGGTQITISGTYLNTGRNITARFGDSVCEDISIEESVATCMTTSILENERVSVPLTMTFDGVEKTFEDYQYTYVPNPIIADIDRTTAIIAGGTDIELTGERFDLVQEKKIVIRSLTTDDATFELCNGTDKTLICPTPPFPGSSSRRKRATDGVMMANLTFDFDGSIIDRGLIEYFNNPEYYQFSETNQIYDSSNQRLEIAGMNLNLASRVDDIQVLLGPDGVCDVDSLSEDMLLCELPAKQPSAGDINGTKVSGPTENLPAVTVKHGNLLFYPGFVRYSTTTQAPLGAIVGGAVGGAVFIFIVMVLIGAVLVKRRQQAIDQQAEEFELLEKKIQNRAEEAYHNLQVDMTEVEDQVRGLGIPFVNTQDYARNMLFSGLDILPATADPEYLDADLERAMIMFSRQLNNPDFLIKYIQELDESRKSHRRDRVNIASLITVILVSEGKFDYFTNVLKRLLEEQISDAADTGRQLKSLFRRTETIVEKLLANWVSLCMYHYLKKHVAKSLYLLYQSIKIQVEKGPIDIITGQSYFSLNFDCLIEEDVAYEEIDLSVVGSNGQHEYYVKVLNTDCITQTKQKILDAAYRRQHFVKQNRAHELDLLWYHPGGEQRILRDQDEYNTPTDNSMIVRVNTLASVGVTADCRVALVNKVNNIEEKGGNYTPVSPGAKMFYIYDQQGSNDVRDRDYTRIQTHREGGFQLWHLIQEDHLGNDAPSRTKLDKEFSAPHLLVTKKTIEPFLEQFLEAVFENPDLTPNTIKHLFDFFDKMATRYCPENPHEYSEAWKSNSLPQHYWVTTLTHPSYIFDMRQSRSADQSVSVLANMLDNACKKIIPEKKQDSSLNRVLFVKDLPKYIRKISDYYRNLGSRQEPTPIELQGEFNRLGQEFSGLFSRVGTLNLLYDFTHNDASDLLDSITELM